MAWIHALQRGDLDARRVDEHGIGAPRIQSKAERRRGARMTLRADGREDVVLYGLKIRGERCFVAAAALCQFATLVARRWAPKQ